MGKSKKDLDRDMMFRKIMPALADNPYSDPVPIPAAEPAAEPQPVAGPIPTGPEQAVPTQDASGPDPVPQPPTEPEPVPDLAPAPVPPPAPAPPFRRAAPAPLLPDPAPGDDPLADLRTQLFARAGVAPDAQSRSVATVNLMETMVLRKLDSAVRKFNCCGCDRCRRDIVAYALNRLPPHYVVADVRHMSEMEEYVEEKQVMAAVIKAVLQVRSNPRH